MNAPRALGPRLRLMNPIVRLKVCLNGTRSLAEHPGLPVTPDQLAVSAGAAVAAGAEAVHVHPRDRFGAESLHADDVGAAVSAVRRTCPGIPVGVSTGLWISSDRQSLVAGWAALADSCRPDFASVNLSETGYVDVVKALDDAAIEIEAGVWSVADANALSLMDPVTRVLVEILDAPANTAAAVAQHVLDRLDELGVPGQRLLHGEGNACWPLVAHAGSLGLATRVGFEDTLLDPQGNRAHDNAALVRTALSMWLAASSLTGGKH